MPSTEQKDTNKRVIRLTPAIGDWTAYKPSRVEGKKIKSGVKGFKRLSEDELAKTLFIHYQFAQKFITNLKADLGVSADLYSVSAEQTTYQNFLKQFSRPVTQYKILTDGILDPTLFMELSLSSSLINRSLGLKDTPVPVRPLTTLEEVILGTLNPELFSPLVPSFKSTFQITGFKFMGAPLLTADSLINFSETFILFTVELSLGENVTRFSLGYPYDTFKALVAKLPEERAFLQLSRLPSSLYDHIMVPAQAELGSTSLFTKDLSRLEEGDVIALDSSLDSLMSVLIGDRLQVLGRPGIKHGKFSLKITRNKQRISKEAVAPPKEYPKTEPLPVSPEFTEPILPATESPLEEETEMKYPFEQGPLDSEEDFSLLEEEEK